MLIAVLAGLVAPGIAQAVPPSNDDFDNATTIVELPFHATGSTVEATEAVDDPSFCRSAHSVWFSFTPAIDQQISADTFGSNFDTVLGVFTGSRGALFQQACNDEAGGTSQSQVVFPAVAGTTYYFQVGGFSSLSGNLAFTVKAVTPPANDNFAAATAIAGLPANRSVDLTAATVEPGEPAPTCFSANRSAWYSFTPAADTPVTMRSNNFNTVFTVYTGRSLDNLVQAGCLVFSPLTVRMTAGVTYYLRVSDTSSGPNTVQLSIDVAPALQPGLGFFPSAPNTFSAVSFFDQSGDPGGAPITIRNWQFGDGTTATGFSVNHTYAADGDYDVRLDIGTADGRTGSVTQQVSVRTHDVGITGFDVPASGRVGRTKPITVRVKNTRYDETVRVDFYRGGPNGFVLVGSLTQLVIARPAAKTTAFPFNYTFTSEDAAVGKVTFRAVATPLNVSDALPVDNEVIATPTRVTS